MSEPKGSPQHVDPGDRSEDVSGSYRLLFEQAAIGFARISLDGRWLQVNQRFCEILGHTEEEILSRSFDEVIPQEETEPGSVDIQSFAERGTREREYRRQNGARIWISLRASLVRDASGHPDHAILVIDDVTRRKRAEERLKLLHDASTALAGSLNYEATLSAVANLAIPAFADWCELFLMGGDGRIRMVESDRMDPGTRALMSAIQSFQINTASPMGVANVIATGKSEFYPEVPDEFWQTISQSPIQLQLLRELHLVSLMLVPLNVRGNALGVLGFGLQNGPTRYDADDLSVAEAFAERAATAINTARLYEEMHAAEARYRGLFHGGAEAIAVLDHESNWIEVNDAFMRLFGVGLIALRDDRGYSDALLGIGSASGVWENLLHDGEWHGELDVTRPDGVQLSVEVSATRVYLPEGPIFLVIWHDVTERRARERFEHNFLADIAHDLQNPMAATRIQTQLMQRRLKAGRLTSDAVGEGLSVIETNIRRMALRIDELSDVAQLRLGRALQLRPERTDLVALAEQCVVAWKQTTDRHRIQVEHEDASVTGEFDEQRIARVLDNLLSNAIKYSPGGGEIAVTVKTDGDDMAEIRVADQGIGIPAADLSNVFERFQRAQNVPGRVDGSGIGLSGSKRIVEQHGGTIVLESEEGIGTTAIVRLPLTASRLSY
jgi:PAS domain S-box-containing protein